MLLAGVAINITTLLRSAVASRAVGATASQRCQSYLSSGFVSALTRAFTGPKITAGDGEASLDVNK
jgi:hypothetical protein